MYDAKSMKAEEFIDHNEIMATLEYAAANKNNAALISKIIEKAKLRKGLSHREAAVLLDCELEDKNQEIYALAEQIKRTFTATASLCLRRCTFLTTALTAACTVRTTASTSTLPAKN